MKISQTTPPRTATPKSATPESRLNNSPPPAIPPEEEILTLQAEIKKLEEQLKTLSRAKRNEAEATENLNR